MIEQVRGKLQTQVNSVQEHFSSVKLWAILSYNLCCFVELTLQRAAVSSDAVTPRTSDSKHLQNVIKLWEAHYGLR